MAQFDINLSQSNLTRHLGDLDNKILQLEGLIAEYRIKKSEIRNFWDDEQAAAYISSVENNIKVCELALRDVRNARANIQTTLDNVVTMNTNVEGYVQKAADAIGKLLVE